MGLIVAGTHCVEAVPVQNCLFSCVHIQSQTLLHVFCVIIIKDLNVPPS